MAGDSRTLKLAILGEVKDLSDSLNKGANEVESFGGKIQNFSKIAGAAMVAAGVAAAAFASKLAIDGVKAAIEDQAAQERLATTLRNVTGAHKAQIAAVEDYILKIELASGVSDDQLRPSLDRLVRSTHDVTKAQELQKLALDVSAGTGKDLATITEALAKAYDGNLGALKRVGVSLDDSILKSKDFNQAQQAIADTFGGQMVRQADTFQGKLARMQVAFNEAKETIGGFILDALQPLIDFIVNNVLPNLQNFGAIFSDNILPILQSVWDFLVNFFTPILDAIKTAYDNITDAIMRHKDEFEKLFDFLKKIWDFSAKYLAPLLGETLAQSFKTLGAIVSPVIDILGRFLGIIESVIGAIARLASAFAKNPLVAGLMGGISNLFGGGKAEGGAVTSGTTYLVGEKGAELFTPSSSGYIVPNGSMSGGNTINIVVNGALDSEATARQIVQILNNSAARGSLGAGAFA